MCRFPWDFRTDTMPNQGILFQVESPPSALPKTPLDWQRRLAVFLRSRLPGSRRRAFLVCRAGSNQNLHITR